MTNHKRGGVVGGKGMVDVVNNMVSIVSLQRQQQKLRLVCLEWESDVEQHTVPMVVVIGLISSTTV